MSCPAAPTPATSMLLVLGKNQPSTGNYPYAAPVAQRSEPDSCKLVALPATYKEAAQLAFDFFKDKLKLETVDDIILKRSMYSSGTLGSLNAEFDPKDWQAVMQGQNIYGSMLEISVFKAKQEDDVGDDRTLDQGKPAPYIAPPMSPYDSYANLPGAVNSVQHPDKMMQMSYLAEDQTAIVKIPDTYEACESVARQIFPTTSGTGPTNFILRSLVHDSLGKASWAVVHPSAYAQTVVKSYRQPLHVQIEFETEKQRAERVKKAKKDIKRKARPGLLGRLFGKSKATVQNPGYVPYVDY